MSVVTTMTAWTRLILKVTPLVLVLVSFASSPVHAANDKIRLTVGQSVTHDVDEPIKTVSIADSKVADVIVSGPYQVLLNGRAAGRRSVLGPRQAGSRTCPLRRGHRGPPHSESSH